MRYNPVNIKRSRTLHSAKGGTEGYLSTRREREEYKYQNKRSTTDTGRHASSNRTSAQHQPEQETRKKMVERGSEGSKRRWRGSCSQDSWFWRLGVLVMWITTWEERRMFLFCVCSAPSMVVTGWLSPPFFRMSFCLGILSLSSPIFSFLTLCSFGFLRPYAHAVCPSTCLLPSWSREIDT
ncbi:hypothetical protein B0H65DRAFT_98629 [Neurospora tetraspora]|uniref:Uncharacterized protein n=1 Tax=Neurospora tetraspora TaxID=94610 RepID=A0AAE0JJF9_9PEZI|nr:hypothetical protein B0H65DRAFT_98629 [Neurospora tetraspora]